MKIGGKIGISHTKDINNAQIAPPIGKLVNDSQGYGMYGLRKVNDGYTGNCIEVREDGGDSYANIGFDAHGNLNEEALLTHCGSNSGFVRTWYDQSGNSQNLAQAGENKQPQIVSSGAVLKTNGRPTIKFDGGNDLVKKNTPNDDAPHAVFFVYRLDTSVAAGKGILSFHEDDADPAFIRTNSSREIEVNFGEAITISGGNTVDTLFQLAIKVKTGTNSKIVLNGRTSSGLVNLGNNQIKSTIVAREEGDTQSNNSAMSCCELIVITERDVTDNEFQAIQNNINGYYNLG